MHIPRSGKTGRARHLCRAELEKCPDTEAGTCQSQGMLYSDSLPNKRQRMVRARSLVRAQRGRDAVLPLGNHFFDWVLAICNRTYVLTRTILSVFPRCLSCIPGGACRECKKAGRRIKQVESSVSIQLRGEIVCSVSLRGVKSRVSPDSQ